MKEIRNTSHEGALPSPSGQAGKHHGVLNTTSPGRRRRYRAVLLPLLLVWLALMALLATTVATSFVSLGIGNMAINVLVAVAKTALVAFFFMQLRHAAPVLRLVALVGLVTLCLLFLLSGADYLTRDKVAASWQRAVPSLQAPAGPSP